MKMKIFGIQIGGKDKGKAEQPAGKNYLIRAQAEERDAERRKKEATEERKKDLEEKVVQVTEPTEAEEELGSGYWSAEEKAENKAQQVNNAMQNINRSYGRMELVEEGYKLLKATQRDFFGKITREAWFAILEDNHDYLIFRQTNKHELDDSSFEFRYKGNGKNLKPGLAELVKKYKETRKQEKERK